MNERENLMKKIAICDFAINEAVLYLDTHPNNQKALEFYKNENAKRKVAVAEYEAMYGPITVNSDVNMESDRWLWTDEPWPWEMEG